MVNFTFLIKVNQSVKKMSEQGGIVWKYKELQFSGLCLEIHIC